MDSLAEFLRMGGYAAYVWPSYLVAAAVLIGLLVATLRNLRLQERRAALLESELPARRRRRRSSGASAPAGGERA